MGGTNLTQAGAGDSPAKPLGVRAVYCRKEDPYIRPFITPNWILLSLWLMIIMRGGPADRRPGDALSMYRAGSYDWCDLSHGPFAVESYPWAV